MATWRKYFNSNGNAGLPVNVTGAPTDGYATTHSRYSSWLPEVYAGSPNRLMRYIQYDQMDNDLVDSQHKDLFILADQFCSTIFNRIMFSLVM